MCHGNLTLKLPDSSLIYILWINVYVIKNTKKSVVTIILQLYPKVMVKYHYHDKIMVITQ